jgi:hypothetical protein
MLGKVTEGGAHLCGLLQTMGGVEDGQRRSTAEEAHGHQRWLWWAPAMRWRTRRCRGPSAWSFSRGREARKQRGGRGKRVRAPQLLGRSSEGKQSWLGCAKRRRGVQYGAGARAGANWRSRGRGPGGRQWLGVAKAGTGRAVGQQGRKGGPSGGPHLEEREGMHEPHMETWAGRGERKWAGREEQ